MIAYRAETTLTGMITQYYKNAENEGRQLVQEILQSDADLEPNYNDNTLTITLHSLSTPRANKAAEKLCSQLNDTQTIYPQTCLKLIFKTFSNDFAMGHES
jgi:hypothetical protein